MKLEPVITEKSLEEAKNGNYIFFVDRNLNKSQIKRLINKTFDVNVVSVRTINVSGAKKRTFRGRKKIIMPKKKAIVRLKDKEKIDLFEEKKK
jgi:large subunit ribosomal protein L23